jgi:bifunctional non-homologous end joining protein LigD
MMAHEALLYALRPRPLSYRKAKLARAPAGIVYNEHTDEDGDVVFRHACKLGFEGIVSKCLTAPYRSGPSRAWIKVKNPDSPAMRRARAGTCSSTIVITE